MLHIMSKHQPSQSKVLARLTDEAVEIDSLKNRIKTLEAKNVVAEDLAQQNQLLKDQLAAMRRTNKELADQIEQMKQQHANSLRIVTDE